MQTHTGRCLQNCMVYPKCMYIPGSGPWMCFTEYDSVSLVNGGRMDGGTERGMEGRMNGGTDGPKDGKTE